MNDRASSRQLIDFYQGRAADHQGRTLEDIWTLSPFWLEHTHDYIQWLFPIPEAGRFNAFAPLLDETVRAFFANDEALRAKQRRSLDVMLAFFGLGRQEHEVEALPGLNIREHTWLKHGSHNHLRISRMIRSLHLCHQPELAAGFQQAAIEIGTRQGKVPTPTVGYWRAATEA